MFKQITKNHPKAAHWFVGLYLVVLACSLGGASYLMIDNKVEIKMEDTSTEPAPEGYKFNIQLDTNSFRHLMHSKEDHR